MSRVLQVGACDTGGGEGEGIVWVIDVMISRGGSHRVIVWSPDHRYSYPQTDSWRRNTPIIYSPGQPDRRTVNTASWEGGSEGG